MPSDDERLHLTARRCENIRVTVKSAVDFAKQILMTGLVTESMHLRFDQLVSPDLLHVQRKFVTADLILYLSMPTRDEGAPPLKSYKLAEIPEVLYPQLDLFYRYIEHETCEDLDSEYEKFMYVKMALSYIALRVLSDSANLERALDLLNSYNAPDQLRSITTIRARVIARAYKRVITECPKEYQTLFPRFSNRFLLPIYHSESDS